MGLLDEAVAAGARPRKETGGERGVVPPDESPRKLAAAEPSREDGAVSKRAQGYSNLIWKIVAGGQTGVDCAALDLALELGIVTGGFMPYDGSNEQGKIPAEYMLKAVPEEGLFNAASAAALAYPGLDGSRGVKSRIVRTHLNVSCSDGTLLLIPAKPGGGSGYTLAAAYIQGKPHLIVRIEEEFSPAECANDIEQWIIDHRIGVLNVAGALESERADIYSLTKATLRLAFKSLGIPSLIHRLSHPLSSTTVQANSSIAAAIEQIYQARDAFIASAQQVLKIIVLGISGLLVALGLRLSNHLTIPSWMPIILLIVLAILLPRLVYLFKHKLRAGYELYAAAVLHATCLSNALGLAPTHRWIELGYIRAISREFVFVERSGGEIVHAMRARPGHGSFPKSMAEYCAVWRKTGQNIHSFYAQTAIVLLVILFAVLLAIVGVTRQTGGVTPSPWF